MDLFYTPIGAKFGDAIPFYDTDRKRFNIFYLKNWNPNTPKEKMIPGWHRLITKDNLTFDETPTLICGGTGSVVKEAEIYHLFYCTFEQDSGKQFVRHAASKDLTRWDEILGDTFGPDGKIYSSIDWRDPFVFWNGEENEWWMLLAARENVSAERNGCVGLCVSHDLSHWEYRKPIYAPRIHQSAHECPDLFQMGDWYYLIYSSYTDGFSTYYRMSRSVKGPWLRPDVDTFDSRAFYAAKTGFDGENRYLYGWNPQKGENLWGIDPVNDIGRDYKTWDWGGALEVHKIVQHADGSLGVKMLDKIESMLRKPVTAHLTPALGNWTVGKNSVFADSYDGFSGMLGGKIPRLCCIRANMKYQGKPSRFGIALQVDQKFSEGYYFIFEPLFNRVQFRSGLRMTEDGGKMFPYTVEMERPIKLKPNAVYKVKILIQDTIAVMYVNDDFVFSARTYNYADRNFGIFVSDGHAEFSDIQLFMKQ